MISGEVAKVTYKKKQYTFRHETFAAHERCTRTRQVEDCDAEGIIALRSEVFDKSTGGVARAYNIC